MYSSRNVITIYLLPYILHDIIILLSPDARTKLQTLSDMNNFTNFDNDTDVTNIFIIFYNLLIRYE
jgi:hypothetical protein